MVPTSQDSRDDWVNTGKASRTLLSFMKHSVVVFISHFWTDYIDIKDLMHL